MAHLRFVPLDDVVVFPGMPVTVPFDLGDDARVLLMPRRHNVFAKVGVVAEVTERPARRRRGSYSLVALHRGVPGAAHTDPDGVLRVEVEERPDVSPAPAVTREIEREYRAVVEEILEVRGDDGRISAFVRSIKDTGALADTAGYSPDLNLDQKLELLETLDVTARLALAVKLQQDRLAELRVRKRIRDDVDSGAQKQQREYFLRQQMDSIRKELGENEASIAEEYKTKIAGAGMPDAVRQQAERELARFERMNDANAEAGMIRTYLDWLLAVPWS
jgi:ATP-dependent Lon protease